jgi:hypothetical protein
MTATKTRKPGTRTISTLPAVDGAVLADITTRQGKRTSSCTYVVRRQAGDFGTCFTVTKLLDGTSYDVALRGNGLMYSEWDCRGHQQWGHRTECRHIALCKQIVAEGKL